ncbi:hypothetical protein ACFSTC_00790 [Nonomuraea ferruginea]
MALTKAPVIAPSPVGDQKGGRLGDIRQPWSAAQHAQPTDHPVDVLG